jgi:uncharacterized membrane protein YuzA (DUF378 family)
MKNLSAISWIAIALVVVGAVNWALVGLIEEDLVASIFGPMSTLSRIIYVLVGIAGVYLVVAATRFREPGRDAPGSLRDSRKAT